MIRESLYRGADGGYLLTDRAFAGADTLATSYALATAIRKIGVPDVILGGRQAIDGDTAQVGPQVAQKPRLSGGKKGDEGMKCRYKRGAGVFLSPFFLGACHKISTFAGCGFSMKRKNNLD